jgi:hypothetical protein
MSKWSTGPDGVAQVYPTAPGGTEFYLNMNNPYEGGSNTSRPTAQFNISYGKGSQLPFTTETAPNGLKYFTTTGNPINYASGSKPGRSVRRTFILMAVNGQTRRLILGRTTLDIYILIKELAQVNLPSLSV